MEIGANLYKNLSLSAVLLLFLSSVLVGCSTEETAESTEAIESVEPAEQEAGVDESEEAIRSVIEKEFNGPDETYRNLWNVMADKQPVDPNQEEYDAFLESAEYTDLMDYMEDSYAEYFTENGYDNFSRSGAFNYSFSEREYQLSTSDIDIVQSDNGEKLYSFTFKVWYEPADGEAAEYEFEGRAIAPEEGKIGKVDFHDKDQLIEDIR
ncbi:MULTISPECIES: hypothetical protein [unclassified Planococcus (in: firmicutes)]|uniref:hypothetical protein n=1 Tax=Planococcus TaxID=1372 RepID=UPI000C32F98B|nr:MULTISPECIES: hypothetical protein [unclassified Planococcus (in: firmicutes)]AUD14450.1 hypothetical protein CW734_13325 [Planococcus sp. MB-3u-03]PKG44724.1 hypothetical protein CXF66_16035 [Planococcus sp. Urea-trap-24]PKG87068.1 hypothetical protein CXF91_13705 [Planococcus sp. Urea-3u-39]PKH41122.1 hypothetical protein CXF77_06860 [Planococcus sp. MB-3u-09]